MVQTLNITLHLNLVTVQCTEVLKSCLACFHVDFFLLFTGCDQCWLGTFDYKCFKGV